MIYADMTKRIGAFRDYANAPTKVISHTHTHTHTFRYSSKAKYMSCRVQQTKITWQISIVRVIKSRRMRWAGHVARMGEGRGVYRVLVGKPERKRPLGRPRRRWDYNIRMDLQEVGLDWIGLAQDRDRWRTLVSAVRNLRVP